MSCDVQGPVEVHGTPDAPTDGATAFPHILNHSSFSVHLDWATVIKQPSTLFEALRALAASPLELSQKRERLMEARRTITYAYESEGGGGGEEGATAAGPDPFSRSGTVYGGAVRAILEELLH